MDYKGSHIDLSSEFDMFLDTSDEDDDPVDDVKEREKGNEHNTKPPMKSSGFTTVSIVVPDGEIAGNKKKGDRRRVETVVKQPRNVRRKLRALP